MQYFSTLQHSYSPKMQLLSSPLTLPSRSSSGPSPSLYRSSPKRDTYAPLLPLSHSVMDKPSGPQNARSSDTKLPSIDQLLLTPPNSTEIPKEHSFPAHHDDHGLSDHALFPPQRRPPSQGSQDSNVSLFSPLPRLQSLPRLAPPASGRAESERRAAGPMLAPLNEPTRRSSDPQFHSYVTSHQSQFHDMHPGNIAPKEEHYQLFVDFLGEMRARQTDDSSPTRPAHTPVETVPPRQPARAAAPQYGPYYPAAPASPAKRPTFMARNAADPDAVEQPDERASTPSKRRRVSSEASEPPEEAVSPEQQPRRRRSAQASRKRGGNGGGIAKETKHNRNRSTKEKKSSNFEDYVDYAPAFETMQSPMDAARNVPEHKVNTRKDLSSDPLKDKLHEAEALVAQRLNIGCAEYLVFKRQVFEVYVQYLRDAVSSRGQWNKTRAQQAGNLDVGKASQIWVFWKNVGWFQEELFADHV